jgi:hypothetical protein
MGVEAAAYAYDEIGENIRTASESTRWAGLTLLALRMSSSRCMT